jgi:hypothetical protein
VSWPLVGTSVPGLAHSVYIPFQDVGVEGIEHINCMLRDPGTQVPLPVTMSKQSVAPNTTSVLNAHLGDSIYVVIEGSLEVDIYHNSMGGPMVDAKVVREATAPLQSFTARGSAAASASSECKPARLSTPPVLPRPPLPTLAHAPAPAKLSPPLSESSMVPAAPMLPPAPASSSKRGVCRRRLLLQHSSMRFYISNAVVALCRGSPGNFGRCAIDQ